MKDLFTTILAAVIVGFLAVAIFDGFLAVAGMDWPQYQGEMK